MYSALLGPLAWAGGQAGWAQPGGHLEARSLCTHSPRPDAPAATQSLSLRYPCTTSAPLRQHSCSLQPRSGARRTAIDVLVLPVGRSPVLHRMAAFSPMVAGRIMRNSINSAFLAGAEIVGSLAYLASQPERCHRTTHAQPPTADEQEALRVCACVAIRHARRKRSSREPRYNISVARFIQVLTELPRPWDATLAWAIPLTLTLLQRCVTSVGVCVGVRPGW